MIASERATVEQFDDLSALLDELSMSEPEEGTPSVEAVESIGETELEAAVVSAEAQEIINAESDEEPEVSEPEAQPVIDPLADPSLLMGVETVESVEPEAPKKEKKAKTKKEPTEKKAPVRKHYASKTERLQDKLGEKLGEFLVLEVGDAMLTGDALKAKQEEAATALKESGQKVQNRMTFIIEFAAGKTDRLNEVATTALKILKADGKITTGEKGNLFLELSKKYKKSSANTMGNNTLLAMRALKMIQGEKGEFVANPNSLYLAKVLPMLGL